MRTLLVCTAVTLSSVLSLVAQYPYPPLMPGATSTTDILSLTVPQNLNWQPLFVQGEEVIRADGKAVPARGKHDFIAFVPKSGSTEEAYLYVGHETHGRDDLLGDGGGGTVLDIRRTNGRWEVQGKPRAVDFSGVGLTWYNCAGGTTPYGTVLTAEEYPPRSNQEIYANGTSMTDTTDIRVNDTLTLKRFENLGWITEVDPVSAKAQRKLYAMGRFSHEAAFCMPDRRTVYLTDDYPLGVFFRFVADRPGDYTTGTLYAYRQSTDGASGSWLPLPRDIRKLVNARQEAWKLGATLFNRLEDLLLYNGKLYISETGRDFIDPTEALEAGAVSAQHHAALTQPDGTLLDFYGRILVFDPDALEMKPYLQGGISKRNPYKNFANPDNLALYQKDGKAYLVVNEDINGTSEGRVSCHYTGFNMLVNEIWFVDFANPAPTLEDAQLFAIGPTQAETTGGVFSPDMGTYFVNVQHADNPQNQAPFNNTSVTVAISGFDAPVNRSVVQPGQGNYALEGCERLFFGTRTDVQLTNAFGQTMRHGFGVREMDITGLPKGQYSLTSTAGHRYTLTLK